MSLINQADCVISLAKRIKGALKSAEHSEILIWVSDLLTQILDLKNSVIDIRGENVKLRETIQELEGKISKSKKWEHDGMRYWPLDENGNFIKNKGAYCATCLDNKDKEIRLLELPNGFYSCAVCKKVYGKWKENDSRIQLATTRRVHHRSHVE